MKDFHPQYTLLSKILLSGLFNREDFKKAYTYYCFNYKNTDQAIKSAMVNCRAFVDLLRKLNLNVSLTIESYMIKPVQRLCKYGLIVNEYSRNMETDHADYNSITETVKVIDKLVHETNDQV